MRNQPRRFEILGPQSFRLPPLNPFAPARRFEQRFPVVAAELPAMLQGYGHVPQSAHAVLTFLEAHFDVNPAVRAAILARCDDPQA